MPRSHSTESNHLGVAPNVDQSELQRQEKEDEETLKQAKTATARLGKLLAAGPRCFHWSDKLHIRDATLLSLCVSIS